MWVYGFAGRPDCHLSGKEHAVSAPTFVIALVERFSRIEPHSENNDPQAQLPNIQEGVCRYHEHAENGFCPWNTGPNRLRLLQDDDENDT